MAYTLVTETAIIAQGESLSGAVSLGAAAPTSILMPALWTAAVLTFQISPDDVTYRDLHDFQGEITLVSAAASRAIALPPAVFGSARFIKIRSGTAAAAVNQAAARSILVSARVFE